MKVRHRIAIALLACMPLVACSNDHTPPPASSSSSQPNSTLGKIVEKEIQEAREKLVTENIGLNGNIRVKAGDGGVTVFGDEDRKDSRPKAEITPKGDLLIEGKAVAINADQRVLLMEYRSHIIGVAESGMEIGVQGADLATKAVGEAFKGLLSGKSEQEIEKTVEAEAAKIKKSAAKLCGRLPGMMASQQKVAAALPEFRPYATMTQDDIDDCLDDSKETASMNPAEEAAAAAEAPTKKN